MGDGCCLRRPAFVLRPLALQLRQDIRPSGYAEGRRTSLVRLRGLDFLCSFTALVFHYNKPATVMYSSSIITTLQLAKPPQRKPILNAYIRELLANFLGMDGPEDITPNQSFIELGTDSLQAVEFKAKLESNLACSLRTTLLFDHPRMDLLVDYLFDDILPLNPELPEETADAVAITPPRIGSDPLSVSQTQPIAIIGLAGLFPGADNAESLWNKAMAGECLQPDPCSPALAFGYGRIDETGPTEDAGTIDTADRQLQLLSRLISQVQNDYQITERMLSAPMTGVFVAAQFGRRSPGLPR